mmetsp:Transcript_3735/g.9891  ORF Transcript_3735/g.9891 Transcript_3735/m.9891 type:complete len:89 (+) Transcript_3735:241-507(+)
MFKFTFTLLDSNTRFNFPRRFPTILLATSAIGCANALQSSVTRTIPRRCFHRATLHKLWNGGGDGPTTLTCLMEKCGAIQYLRVLYHH